MGKIKISLFFLAISISLFNCSEDDTVIVDQDSTTTTTTTTEETTPETEIPENPILSLDDERILAITTLTDDSEKVWQITSAELENSNGTFDISENFNIKDDEFIFKNSSLTTAKNLTDFEISLEWKKYTEVNLSADSPESASIEYYVPSALFSIDFEAESSTMLTGNDGDFEFTLADNGTMLATLTLDDALLRIILDKKPDFQLQTVPTSTLQFTSEFTFDSNAVRGSRSDIVASLANNSIYISMREDALADPLTGQKAERVLKYDLNTSVLTEKLFYQTDFVTKHLIVNNNKLLVLGGQHMNTYDLDIIADPVTSKTYLDASGSGNLSFFLSRFGTAIANDQIYLVGGNLGDTTQADRIYKFDIATEVLTEFAIMPETRSGASAEIINGRLYIFGGTEEFFTPPAENSIYIYDLSDASLTIETMPTAVDFTYAGRSGDVIFVGGNKITTDAGGTTTDQEPYLAAYDTDNGTYTELQTDLSSPGLETIQSMAVIGNKIYVVYGKQLDQPAGQLQTWSVLSASF